MGVEKRNLLLNDITESVSYRSTSQNRNNRIPERDHASHAKVVRGKYDSFISQAL